MSSRPARGRLRVAGAGRLDIRVQPYDRSWRVMLRGIDHLEQNLVAHLPGQCLTGWGLSTRVLVKIAYGNRDDEDE